MNEKACPACNGRARRAWAAYETAWQAWADTPPAERGEAPEQPDIPIIYGEPVFCGRCTAVIRRSLADLDELVSLLVMMRDGYQAPGRNGSERVKSTKAAPTPSPAQDDLDELVRWLGEAERAYRASQGWPMPPYRGVNAPALTSVVSWLGTHLDAILRIDDLAEDFGLGVIRWYRTLQGKTSTRPPVKHKPLPCPRCRRLSLFLHDDETVRCAGRDPDCGRIMTASEYGQLEAEADNSVVHREAS